MERRAVPHGVYPLAQHLPESKIADGIGLAPPVRVGVAANLRAAFPLTVGYGSNGSTSLMVLSVWPGQSSRRGSTHLSGSGSGSVVGPGVSVGAFTGALVGASCILIGILQFLRWRLLRHSYTLLL